jgi:hypothetical protein
MYSGKLKCLTFEKEAIVRIFQTIIINPLQSRLLSGTCQLHLCRVQSNKPWE